MRKWTLAFVALAVLWVPTPAFAWGAAAHRLITQRAIELLPPGLKAFFEHYQDEFVMRSNDPDLWRNVPWDDDANHFIDFGVREYGEPPFTALPRERGAALQKFGEATLKRFGMLPWRVEEMSGSLRRGFEGMARRNAYSISDVVLFAAAGAHYVQDATQPFHATVNYDGLQTGNAGIHSRFERDLIEKFSSRLRLAPSRPSPMVAPRDWAFDTTIEAYGLVDGILAADKAAIGTRDTYDDQYFEAFIARVQPVLEQQLSTAISATAAFIIGAWDQAGRPALYTTQPRTPQRVRR